MNYFNRILRENEELISLVRKHPLAFAKTGLIASLLLITPFFLMFSLFQLKEIGLVLFIVILVAGLLCLIRVIRMWRYNVFLITDKRVILIKQRGLWDRHVSEIEYEKIQDIAFRIKGIKQTLFRFGSIKIQIHSSESAMIVNQVPNPQKLQQLLLSIKRKREFSRAI